MGDRALVIVHDKEDNRVSPTMYLHHHGHNVPNLLRSWWEYMEGRHGDTEYGFARLVGVAHQAIPGPLSLGVWATPITPADESKPWVGQHIDPAGYADWLCEQERAYRATLDTIRGNDYSHGDAGVFLVDCRTGEVTCHNGYGAREWGEAFNLAGVAATTD